MKRSIPVAFTILVTVGLVAHADTFLAGPVPRLLAYDGTLELNGVPMTQQVTARFSLWDSASGGTSLGFQEDLTFTPANGRFSVLLGASGTPLPDTVFGADAVYLEVRIPATAASPLTGRQRIVPALASVRASQANAAQQAVAGLETRLRRLERPLYCGKTAQSLDRNGYAGVRQACEAVPSCGLGATQCTANMMGESAELEWPMPSGTNEHLWLRGQWSYYANQNINITDCDGWSTASSTVWGNTWYTGASGTSTVYPSANACSVSASFACCRYPQ